MSKKLISCFISVSLFIILINFSIFAADSEGNTLLSEGIDFFRQTLYKQAVINFRDILINPDLSEYHGDAYFWIAKSYMVLSKLKEAEKNLEYYLMNFIGHKDYPEAMYQKGRLLFMQNEYENAIQVMTDYIDKYPNSVFQSNAYFWIGESLFLMGKLDDAIVVFKNIVQNYPTSFKFEAAKYRMSIIEFKKRENELLKLLKWSHMEALKSMEDFQKKERTYEQAISSYQKKIAILDNSVESNVATRIAQKDAQIDTLKQENAELQTKIQTLENTLNNLSTDSTTSSETGTTTANLETSDNTTTNKQNQLQARLLKIKSDALELKALLLNLLETNISGGQ